MFKYPVYQPLLAGNEKKYVNDCLDSSWISSRGTYVASFEAEFSKFTSIRHSATVANGTVALHLALVVLGVGPGDEVIVPTFTYIASVNAIQYAGATPVFVDSLEGTWQLDPADVRRKVTPKTKAIMAVHLYGHPCEMNELKSISQEHGLFLVEDCAEAFGTLYQGKHVGGFGDISTFSFFGNKTITTGEGGMVCTNDPTLHDRVVHFRGQGLAKHRQYWHDVIGYNYRMTNICAAIGLAQLERASSILEKKAEIADWYSKELKGLPLKVHAGVGDVKHSYWMVSILLDDGSQRDELRNHLEKNGIETRPLFYPVHTMPMHAARFQKFPVAERLARSGINVPSYPGLEAEMVTEICAKVREFYR